MPLRSATSKGDFRESASSSGRDTEALKDFLENATDAMHWVGADGTILWANRAELDLLGYKGDEYIGHNVAEFHVDRVTIEDMLSRLWRNETLREYPARMRRSDGSIRDVVVSSSVFWQQGKFVHTRCITRDVTEQKQLERERHRALRHLAAEHSVAAILTRPRPLADMGSELLRTIGEVGEWQAGAFWLIDDGSQRLRCVAFWRDGNADAGIEQFEAVTRTIGLPRDVGLPGRVWESSRTVWIDNLSAELNFPRIGVARQAKFQSGVGAPVRARGRIIGVLEFFGSEIREPDSDLIDMLGAVGAQVGHLIERREVDEMRERLAAIVDSSDDAIVSKTLDGTITSWNRGAERMFGYSADEVIGRPIYMIVPPERHTEEDEVLARLRRGEKIDHYDTERLTKDGRRLNIALTVSPVRNAEGEIVGASKVARDVTERKRAVEDLEAARRPAESASRAKDEFLAMLGHELRNPLAPILTALQLIELRGGDAVRERAVIDRQVRHLVRLVDDLLDVSRIARGKIELRREIVELADIVMRAVEMASPLLEERQHALDVNVPRTGLLVDVDVTRLSQVVMNLLTNAAKYTEPGGLVQVGAALEGEQVVLSVRDNGMGIFPALVPHVFDLFVQGSQTFDRSQGGLGLGLTIVRSLVQLHGGSVDVRSQGPGCGSEFLIRLPAAAGAARRKQDTDLRLRLSRASRSLRVLVVDDNIDGAHMVAEALSAVGDITQTAVDGPSALAAAAAFHPHVALLDLGLPVMDGYELAQHLRTGSAGRPPVLIAVTGYGQDADRERSHAAGFSLHIVKPVDLEVLNRVLDRVAAGELAATDSL